MRTVTSLAACFAVSSLAAQTIEPGYDSDVTALPNGAGQVLVLSNPDATVYFTGTDLMFDDGQSSRSLLNFSNSVFGSFTIRVDRDNLLFGESSNGDLWLVPFRGSGQPRQLANLTFNYDATTSGSGVLVSAKTGGFGANDNDVFAIDLGSGTATKVAIIPGASGPLTRTRGGVYYATASNSFPPPPSSVKILFFSDRQIGNAIRTGTPLGESDARLVATGFDAAGDIATDADGDIFITDWRNSQVVEISFGPGGQGRVSTLASYPAGVPSAGGLQSVRGSARGRGSFEPFQPATTDHLALIESQFGGGTQIRELAPERAETTTSVPNPIPPGAFDIVTTGAPAGGIAVVAFGLNGIVGESAIPVRDFEQTVFWDRSMFSAFNTVTVPIDAQGQATLSMINPGVGRRLTFSAQVAFVNADGTILGSGAPADIRLQ